MLNASSYMDFSTKLRYTNCPGTYWWDGRGQPGDRGPGSAYPSYTKILNARTATGQRTTAIGTLQHDVQPYNEQDLRADLITAII